MKLWTVGTAWYLCLSLFDSKKVKIARDTFYKYIKDLCDEVGVTRAQLNIITGVRAELYFDGGWTSVSLDSIKELTRKGTDVIFIEKQGVPELLAELADKYGIAMVNTRGKLVEYAKDLMNAIKLDGGHVLIMTDYDNSGIKIASETPTEIPWIGANDKMLKHFELPREKVSVPTENYFSFEYVKYLAKHGVHPTGKNYKRSGEKDERFKEVDIRFLRTQRVELDAIIAAVGEERFFEYITHVLKELYPKRDYTRVIEITDLIELGVPDEKFGTRFQHEESIIKINDVIQGFLEPNVKKIDEGLMETNGLLEVEKKRKDIKKTLGEELINDVDYQDFAIKLSQLVDTHEFSKNLPAESNLKKDTPPPNDEDED